MGIKEDVLLRDKERAAAGLIAKSTQMRTQKTQAENALTTLKAKLKNDIAGDVFDDNDFISFTSFRGTIQSVEGQQTSVKAQLIQFKYAIPNGTYKSEIQDEIDLLP